MENKFETFLTIDSKLHHINKRFLSKIY